MMRINHSTHYFTLLFFLIFLTPPNVHAARETNITGSIALRQSYDSNIDRTDSNTRSEWTSTLAPALTLTSSGRDDHISFSYEPGFVFNHRTDEDRIDHHLSLDADKNLSAHWRTAIHDSFTRSDDTLSAEGTEPAEGDVALSENRERARFRTNSFSATTEFQYAQESLLSLGYSHQMLDNDDSDLGDYRRHNPNMSISHRFNHQWRSDLSYGFTKGNFDLSNDIKTHDSSLRVNYQMTPANTIFGNYGFTKTNYENNPDDYTVQSGSLGWGHDFSQFTTLQVSGGTSYADREIGANESGATYSFSLNRELQHGSFSFTGDGGFDELHYNGTSDGISRFWSLQGALTYQLLEKVSSSINGLFREDNYLERAPEEKEKTYGGGITFSYAFHRWYTLSLNYMYRHLDADIDVNDYDDHRLFLALAVTKELWRW